MVRPLIGKRPMTGAERVQRHRKRKARKQREDEAIQRLRAQDARLYSPLIKPMDNWNFSPVVYGRIDGEGGHGYIPGEVYANCLWYWTKPGDIVVAPMAGAGQIMRVYEDRATWTRPEPWNLDLHLFDLTPRGPYRHLIQQNDATVGIPVVDPDYIVMDVPYYGMVAGQYSSKVDDLANMDREGWVRAIEGIARSSARAQGQGGLCTVITPNFRDVTTRDVFLAPRAVEQAFREHGYLLHDTAYASRRIQQDQGLHMPALNNAAKRARIMLTDVAEVATFVRQA